MDEDEIRKLYKDLGIPEDEPYEDNRKNEYDFFPEYGHIAWIPLKV